MRKGILEPSIGKEDVTGEGFKSISHGLDASVCFNHTAMDVEHNVRQYK